MSDADRLDRLLTEAGERWRATQPPAPAIDAVWRPAVRGSQATGGWALVTATLAVVVAAAAFAAGGHPSVTPSGSPMALATPAAAATVPASCPVTTAREIGPLASQVAGLALPDYLAWYGSPKLWTIIPRSGTGAWWSDTYLRVFWYSSEFSVVDEPNPAISVSAGRLGGGDSVTGGPAVNARSADLGTSMIVPLALPSGGCWQITGTYRDQSLSYVVWIAKDVPSSPTLADATSLPTEIDGVPVLVGDAARAAFAGSINQSPILVGGWLAADLPMLCPNMRSPDPFNACRGLQLRDRPFWGPSAMALYGGTGVLSAPAVGPGMTQPVVFRVHTHDSSCVSNDCIHLPVVDQLVWSGTISPIPSPTSTQPPNGVTQGEAERLALAAAGARAAGAVSIVTVRSGHYAEVGPPGSMDFDGDRWVWSVVVLGQFGAPDVTFEPACQDASPCPRPVSTSLVVLDYVTGDVLIQETPAPSS